jgi:hypothetical protein
MSAAGQTSRLRFLLGEAAGTFGDLGTFVPIAVGLVQVARLDAGAVLVWTGLACIVSGVVFRVPMAVQPMKAIGALAIAGFLTADQIGLAGITVGVCMLAVGTTPLAGWLDRTVPKAVLRGLQLAVAVQLIRSGVLLGLFTRTGGALRSVWGADGLIILGVAALLPLVLCRRLELASVLLVLAGLVGAAISRPGLLAHIGLSLWQPRWVPFTLDSLAGLWNGGLAQVPLTLVNSVFSVSVLAGQLFPRQQNRNTPARLAISVGLINLIVCPLGGMPLCHGAGGLAAQHRLGGRTGLTVVLRGMVLFALGLWFSTTTLAWLQAFPGSILGIFLVIAGFGLAEASRCWTSVSVFLVAAVVVVAYLATGLLLVGFVAGWVAHMLIGARHPIWGAVRLVTEGIEK